MINSRSRQSGIHGTNFQRHATHAGGEQPVNKYRNASLKLAFRLTKMAGAVQEIYRKRLEEQREVAAHNGAYRLNGKAVVGAIRKFNIEAWRLPPENSTYRLMDGNGVGFPSPETVGCHHQCSNFPRVSSYDHEALPVDVRNALSQ